MEYRIIPRSEWGARYGSSGLKRPVGHLEKWLHHSVTVAPDLVPPFTDDYAAIRTIERIGHERFGSYGFPYTLAFTPAGLIFEGHPIDEVGAHTQGHNTAGAGFVLVGNYENDHPTDAQVRAIAWALQEGVRRGWWGYAELDGGHRDTKATACPGRYGYAAIDDINRLSRGATIPTNPQEDWLDMTTKKEFTDWLDDWARSPRGRQSLCNAVLNTDGVLEAPSDTSPKNKFWTGKGFFRSIRSTAQRAEARAEAAEKVAREALDLLRAERKG